MPVKTARIIRQRRIPVRRDRCDDGADVGGNICIDIAPRSDQRGKITREIARTGIKPLQAHIPGIFRPDRANAHRI